MSRKASTKYQHRFIEDVDEHFRKGGTIRSFPAALRDKYGIRITRRTIYNWIKQHPKFSRAIEMGNCIALMELEYLLHKLIMGTAPNGPKKVNYKALEFVLKTRFHKTYGTQGEEDAEGENKVPEIVIIRPPKEDKP